MRADARASAVSYGARYSYTPLIQSSQHLRTIARILEDTLNTLIVN